MLRKMMGICVILIIAALTAWAQTDTSGLVMPTAADKELAANAIAAAKAAQGTPGQEQANFLLYEWPGNGLKTLSSDKKVSPGDLGWARSIVNEMYDVIKKGPTWPRPAKVTVPYTSKPPVIDGKLDDAAWAKAFTYTTSYYYNNKELLTTPVTTWKILWDKKYLYFAFDCEDDNIIAPVLPRDGMPFKDDSVEIFLLPEFRQSIYWELVVGATGSIYDGLNAKKFNGWGGISRVDETINGLIVATSTDGTANKPDDKDKKYTVEIAVPFKELPTYTRGNLPHKGDLLNFSLARMDKEGDVLTQITPYPMLSWGHNIWNYAPMELGK